MVTNPFFPFVTLPSDFSVLSLIVTGVLIMTLPFPKYLHSDGELLKPVNFYGHRVAETASPPSSPYSQLK